MSQSAAMMQLNYLQSLSKKDPSELENYQEGDESKFLAIFGTRILERFETKEKAQQYINSAPLALTLFCPETPEIKD